MKKIFQEYKENIKYFVYNKKYLIMIVLVAILSYGFAITHYSIGIDDLCFDRYVQGTYILSAKRWGTWLLYNILQINKFTPFWLDAVVSVFMIVLATVLCAFIKKQYGDKIKIGGYILFSSLLISNPLINQFFIYQSTNLAIVVSNLIIIICGIIIFENYFGENKKWIHILSGLILTIPISMYESCAQTYLVFMFAAIFIKLTQDKISNKKIFQYFCWSIAMLVVGIAIYFITGKLVLAFLENHGILQENFAYVISTWQDKVFKTLPIVEKIKVIEKIIMGSMLGKPCYLPIIVFLGLSFITMILELIKLIKTSKVFRIICVLGGILSNFVLIFLLLTVLYRMQFSWIVTTAFLGIYVYQSLSNKAIIKYIVTIMTILLIAIQTRTLNQHFYNDYKRYENEKTIANDIGMNVMKSCDYKNKPLFYVKDFQKGYNYIINRDNSVSVLLWGLDAFKECQTEITKFINEQGYHFMYITEEIAKKANKIYEKLDESEKKKAIIELDDVIIVNLNVYDF